MEESQQQSSKGYGKRPMWQWITIYAVIAIFVYGIIYYFAFANKSGNPYQPAAQQSQTPSIQQSKMEPSAMKSASPEATQTITVTGNEFAFIPATITVKQGQQVKVTFKNTGKYPHNFTVSDLAVKTKTIQTGQEDTITFTSNKKGSFPYICTVPGHADKGMKGTLTVE